MIGQLTALLRLVCVPVVSLSMLFPASAASAQGTMGQLPGPMSSEELHQHLGRFLEFDIDEALLMGALHAAYLVEFKELREGRIAAFLESAQDLDNGGAMPDIRKVRKFVDQQAAIQTAIRKLDDRLFSQVGELFSAEDMFQLERARNSRARIRARSGLTAQMGLMGTQDLWMIVDQLELTGEQRQAFSQALLPWEDRSTVLSKQAAKAGSSMMVKMVEKFDELGFTGEEFSDMDYSDPENAQKLRELMMTIQQVFMEVQAESGEAVAKIRRLNSRTSRDLDGLLDPWLARSFKDQYLAGTGIGAGAMFSDGFEEESIDFDQPGSLFLFQGDKSFKYQPLRFVDFFRSSALIDPEDRQAIEVLFQAYLQSDHALLDESIKLHEEIDPTMMGFEAMTAMGEEGSLEDLGAAETPMMKLVRGLQESGQRRVELRSQLMLDLAQLLELRSDLKREGELLKQLKSITPDEDVEDRMFFASGFSSAMPGLTDPTLFISTPQPWIVDPLDRAVIDRLVERLGEEDWLKPVIETMHQDYLVEWQDRITPLITSQQRALSELYSGAKGVDGVPSMSPPTVTPSTVSARLRAAIEAIRIADIELFDSISTMVPDDLRPTIELERNARLIEIALGGAGQQPGMSLSEPSILGTPVNLLEIVATLELTPEQRTEVFRGIDSEQDSLVAARRALQESWIEYAQADQQDQFDYLVSQANSDDPGSVDVIPSRLPAASQEMTGLTEATSASEKAFMARVLELLPTESHGEFRRSVGIARHPAIYGYDDDLDSTFELLDRMSSLRAEQLAELEVMRSEFEQLWSESGDRLVDCLGRMQQPQGMSDRQGWQDYMKAQMEQEQLAFDRREHARQGLLMIAGTLDAEQRRRIPALRKLASQASSAPYNQRRVDVPVDQP